MASRRWARSARLLAYPVFAAVLLALAGCTTVTGRAIPADQVAGLTPGKTTLGELGRMLGKPARVLARDESFTIDMPVVKGWVGKFPSEPYRLRGDAYFTLFPEAGKPGVRAGEYRIYYYYRAASSTYSIPLLVYWGYTGSNKMDQLWVLVDERTGIVADYAYRPFGKDTTFGTRGSASADTAKPLPAAASAQP